MSVRNEQGAIAEPLRHFLVEPSRFHRVMRGVWLFARRKPLGFIGALLVLFFMTLAIFGPWIAPHDPMAPDFRNRLAAPSSQYLLGTDPIGRDILSRLIDGARLSMYMGFGAVFISSIVATVIALVSAYLGGWVDSIIQRFVDAMIALPDLIILITILGIIRRIPDANLILAMLFALALFRIAPASRVFRSVMLEVRARPFVEAAEAAGATPLRAMFQHVLPNVFPLILVAASIAIPAAILAEASLSFLGFGPDGTTSWGQMLSAEGREYFRSQPGLAIWPGVAIALTVFGFQMFGDALRDLLDPRLRGNR